MYSLQKNPHVKGEQLVAVRVSGEIDIDCAADLRQEIEKLTESPVQHLLVDIDEVDHLDSYSLGSFVALRQRMRGRQGTMGIVCHTPKRLRLFEMTNLDKLFAFHSDDRSFADAHGGAFDESPSENVPRG